MNLKTLILSSILAISLTACASTNSTTAPERTSNANDSLVCKVPFDFPRIEPVEWDEFEWKVLTNETVERMVAEGEEIYYIGLTYEGYTSLSTTMQDILRYTRQQRSLINDVEAYYSNEE